MKFDQDCFYNYLARNAKCLVNEGLERGRELGLKDENLKDFIRGHCSKASDFNFHVEFCIAMLNIEDEGEQA